MEAAVKPKEMEQKRDIGIFSSGVQGNCIGQGVFTDRKEKDMGNQMIRIILAVCIFFGGICPAGQAQAAAGSKKEADSITYIQFSDMQEALPVSYIQKGKQLLTGDGDDHVYSRLQNTLFRQALPAEKLPYNAKAEKALYGKKKRPDYSCRVMASGSWELFPDTVRYQAYSLDRQPSKSSWNRYFKKYLKKHAADSPVVIKESYAFDWNGAKMELVTASNVSFRAGTGVRISDGRNQNRVLPQNRSAAVYTVSALFQDGTAVADIFSNIQKVSRSRSSGGVISFCQPPEGEAYQDYIESVQTGADGKWKKFRCYFDMAGELEMREYRYFPELVVCDADGDGKSEIAVYCGGSGSLRQRLMVYSLADGKLERSFSIGP